MHEETLQVFEASAMMEWHHDNSNVKVPKNIWELGAKRFMAEPGFVLAYIHFQLGLGDTANSRATFERALTVTPVEYSQPLWDGYLCFESQVSCMLAHMHFRPGSEAFDSVGPFVGPAVQYVLSGKLANDSHAMLKQNYVRSGTGID